MAQYFQVKVQFTVEVNGKLKKQSVNYLVDAMSVTEAEARIVEPALETLAILVMAPVLMAVDVSMTWIRLYKERKQ